MSADVPEVRKLGGLPRTNSEDSGVYSAVYDDDSAGEDAGYGGELTDDTADDIADDTEQQVRHITIFRTSNSLALIATPSDWAFHPDASVCPYFFPQGCAGYLFSFFLTFC